MRWILLVLVLFSGCATSGGHMATRVESRLYHNNPLEDVTIASSEVVVQF